MNYSPEEIEDAKYEIWLLNNGPAKKTEEQRLEAEKSIVEDLESNGWNVLRKNLVKPWMQDVSVIEVVVERGDSLQKLQWKPFNKGWMQKMESGGWGIFFPA